MTELERMGEKARAAARVLAGAGAKKQQALLHAADCLSARAEEVLKANAEDLEAAQAQGMRPALQDRLRLTGARIEDMCRGLRETAAYPDPVGRVLEGTVRPNGLCIEKVCVPLGVIGIIFEARPNVTSDAAGLIRAVVENARVPVIETGVFNCHVYVDETSDIEMAARIIDNAKTSRPSVCNAIETILVHRNIAEKALPVIAARLREKQVELHADEATCAIVPGCVPATEADWETEYLDYILAVKVVDSIDDAIAHIARYSTGHSECIVTENYANAQRFTREVDAAAVYVNASTRFTDGGQFGLGAEIGISTQKLHARGPMGVDQLTSTKFVIRGEGQIRG